MATTFRFPPSTRDFALQRAVHFEGLSTWQAATRFGISQPRVRQILRRVADWTAEVLPPRMEAEDAARLRYAEHLASDRLEHHYQETMEQWRATHQTRFLMQAMRVALAAGKLAAASGVIEALAADVVEGPLEEAVGSGQSAVGGQETVSGAKSGDPLDGDFSAHGDLREEAAEAGGDENRASAKGTGVLELLRGGAGSGNGARMERARSLLSAAGFSAAGGEGITQVRITPDQPGASVERQLAPPQHELTRQERRRLQKKLKRAKGLT